MSHALHRVPEGGERPLALAAFRNRHQGDAIVVCGCGTSLKELTNPGQYITVGVNDVGRLFDPTYLVVVNPRTQFKNDRFRYVEQSNAQALFTQLDLGRVAEIQAARHARGEGEPDTAGKGRDHVLEGVAQFDARLRMPRLRAGAERRRQVGQEEGRV